MQRRSIAALQTYSKYKILLLLYVALNTVCCRFMLAFPEESVLWTKLVEVARNISILSAFILCMHTLLYSTCFWVHESNLIFWYNRRNIN